MKTLCLIMWGLALAASAQRPTPALISSPGAATVSASGSSYAPLLSADRKHTVFLSNAKNLVTNDTLAPYLDVFRHDLMTGETKLISSAANADSRSASVSSNGQWVAFASAGNNLLPAGDSNSSADIFLADANSGALSLISVGLDGNSPPNPSPMRNLALSDKPHISADGRWIAFESFATSLTVDVDANNESDVFLRDTVSNETILISVAREGGATANGKSEIVGIAPDGNFVLFSSTATNLVSGNRTERNPELYLRDLGAGTTIWVRHPNIPPPPGGPGMQPHACRWAMMSRDANFVLYKVETNSLLRASVHLYDRQNNSNIVVSTTARIGSPVHMSSDARFIVYDQTNHVFLWDRQTDVRTQVSVDGISHSPVVSDDGSVVAFVSGLPTMPLQIYCRDTATGDLRQLTQTLSAGSSLKDHYGSSITVDPSGEFILFDSADHDLVSGDRNRASDIFLHQVATGETRLISRAHPSSPAVTASGRAGITNFCVSADGNRILFLSSDSDLVPGDSNGWPDAFLHEIDTGRTYPLTTNENGLFSPTNSVAHGVLSANGRYALLGLLSPFRYDWGSGLAPITVLRKDLETGETVNLLSNVPIPLGPYPPVVPYFGFSISDSGQVLAYPSNAGNIVADLQNNVQTQVGSEPLVSPDGLFASYVNNAGRELALVDLQTGERRIINSSYIRGAAFVQNSQSIVYSAAVGLGPGINLYSVSARSNTLVCMNCRNPRASGDARFIAYQSISSPYQVEVKDMLTGRTTLVTQNIYGTGGGNADVTFPVISADGRFVAYTSKATNLTTDLPNGWNNLYLYDRIQGTTIRITGSRGNTGYGSGSASRPVIGPGGRTLVFQSFASDFVDNDFNDTRDIFLLTLGSDDSDNDGMPDDWEHTHFSTTERDGTGDIDQDGQIDLAEYLGGTNPNNAQSVLEVLQITSIGTGQRQLIWAAQPGKSYRLEYKTDLSGATWTSLGQVITATQPTASATDPTATTEKRFYRVALVQ